MSITIHPTFPTFEKFEKGETIKVTGERGLWKIVTFREDLGGVHAICSNEGNGCRVFTIDRLHRISKRKKATIEE
jgi:hypothetical protein